MRINCLLFGKWLSSTGQIFFACSTFQKSPVVYNFIVGSTISMTGHSICYNGMLGSSMLGYMALMTTREVGLSNDGSAIEILLTLRGIGIFVLTVIDLYRLFCLNDIVITI